MNKKIIVILSILILNILTSCSDDSQKLKTKKNVNQNSNTYIENWNNNIIISKIDESNKILTIDDKCIWCWKCVMIAPNNFSMDYSTLKAIVINQQWMFSSEVTRSIQVCPVDSINIG